MPGFLPVREFSAVCVATGFIAASAQAAGPCAEFSARLPNVTMAVCEAGKLQPSAGKSVKGQTLWVRDVKPLNPNPRVLVVGAIHGDEPSLAAVALHWIGLSFEAPVDTPQTVHWRFVPVLNPDGVLTRPPRRVNGNGVDLNLNFPTPNWERDADAYWQRRTGKDPRRWPGPKPLSEPESQFLQQQMQSESLT